MSAPPVESADAAVTSALDSIDSRPDSWLRFDQRILLLALTAGFPAALVAIILLWTGDYTPKVQWTLTVFIVGVWASCSFSVRHRVVPHPGPFAGCSPAPVPRHGRSEQTALAPYFTDPFCR